MPAGRPSTYTTELIEKAQAYLDGGYESLGHEIPSHAGLSVHLGVTRKTLYHWAKEEDKPEFCDILDRIMTKQQMVLVMKGLSNKFNAQITKLILGKHGYHDKVDQENTGKDGGPIRFANATDEEIEAKIKSLLNETEET